MSACPLPIVGRPVFFGCPADLDKIEPGKCGCGVAELDGDGDVDLADFGVFQLCFTGIGSGGVEPDCVCADIDNDCDVDLTDFNGFQLLYTGPM